MRPSRLLFSMLLALQPAGALAHMPLLRELSVLDGGARRVGHMPGFGFLIEEPGAPPRYACDALAGLSPIEIEVPWLLLPGGELLVGSQSGLRRLSRDGCPSAESVSGLPKGEAVTALAQTGDGVVYALIGLSPPRLHRSSDAGHTFELVSELPSARRMVGMIAAAGSTPDGDTRLTLVDQVTQTQASVLLRSVDGGRTWASEWHEGSLWPLYSHPDGSLLLRRALAGRRGQQLIRIAAPGAEPTPVLDLNFFGGSALEPVSGELWVGDEGGGLYRSGDMGLTFSQAGAEVAPACLTATRGQLWACLSGLPAAPAIARLNTDSTWGGERSLAEVTQLVQCDADADVASVCAAAWQEWRLDVLLAAGVPLDSHDAGAYSPDASIGLPALDGGLPDAALGSGGSGVRHVEPPARGCQVGMGSVGAQPVALLACLLPLFVMARARRPGRRSRCAGVTTDALHPSALRCVAMAESPEQVDDAVLIDAAQRGDADAFLVLFDRHAPTMLAVGCRILGDAAQAEDLLQDVFIEAWSQVRAFDPLRASVRTWLLVRLRSRALDRLSSRAREARQYALLAELSQPGVQLAEGVSRTAAVRKGLRQLDSDVRTVLELTYYLGMTAPEIAVGLSLPEGTVRSRLARGLRGLQQLLAEAES